MNSKNDYQENNIVNPKLLERIKEFANEHRDVLKEISGLTNYILIKQLQEACKYDRGYYKNDKGEYIYVKGIEVTNDTGNLLRMGFNGEDNGVWIHISEVDEKSVRYRDIPIFVFTGKFDENFTPKDELMRPTTKEDFEDAVKRATENIISDYPQKREPEEYLYVALEWAKLVYETISADTIEEFPE